MSRKQKCYWNLVWPIGIGLLVALGLLIATPSADAKPKYTTIIHPTPKELEAGFADWAKRYPQSFRVEVRGKSVKGRPILMCRITDYGVPDEDKQVAMLTSCHVAKELNAGTGLLRLIKWLISDDPAAAEIRKKQNVLVVPYTDPDGVAHHGGSELYRCWSPDGVVDPEKHPEAVVLQGIMDQYTPDLFIDYHGFPRAEQKMWESTGISWASAISRCYLHDVPRLINEAAEASGFLITRGEEDAGQIIATCDVRGASEHYYLRKLDPNVTIYPYNRFHTLAMIMEVGFEESLIVRTRRALQIGHERWRGERYAGYPANQVGCWASMAVSAWGTTATERRLSRCELWQKLAQLSFGCAGPEPRGSITAYCATTPAGRDKYCSRKPDDLVKQTRSDPRFDADALADMVERIPATNIGGGSKYDAFVPPDKVEPIKHGLVLRLLAPYNDARVTDIRLDGRLLKVSATDGRHIRRNPGTIVEIAIPPEKVREFHIASCFYDSPTKRRAGFRPEDW